MQRFQRRRTRRSSSSSKLLRSLLLSLGLCGLALSVVLVGWGLLRGNNRLVTIGACYPPASLASLLLRWVLLQRKERRKHTARRHRVERDLGDPVPS